MLFLVVELLATTGFAGKRSSPDKDQPFLKSQRAKRISDPGIESAWNPTMETPGQTQEKPPYHVLLQNFPNPFRSRTTLVFSLSENSIVTLKVYDLSGEEVATLFDKVELSLGGWEFTIDARNLSSGVYLNRILVVPLDDDDMPTGKKVTETMKMMLVK